MNRDGKRPSTVLRHRSKWMHLAVTAAAVLSMGIGQSYAVPVQLDSEGVPIFTASGQAEALKQATVDYFSPPATTGGTQTLAPISPTDATKVPHYFGPWPNWANSPFTTPDATVTIADNGGPGAGATAVANVSMDPATRGQIADITITNPGVGYTDPIVTITGPGLDATADATFLTTSAVTAINVTGGGAGYAAMPAVTLTPPATPGGTTAVAIARGGVDAVIVNAGGSGYQFPTVSFDSPSDPNGVAARGHVVCGGTDDGICEDGIVSGIVVDNPGSGYSTAPSVVIRDGTIFDPIISGTGASATATLRVRTVSVIDGGSGYTAVPTVTFTPAGATATALVNVGSIDTITVTNPGSGYIVEGMKKFTDGLPKLCFPNVPGQCDSVANNLGQYIPAAIPDTQTFSTANGYSEDSDFYVIALVQTREQLSSSLPASGTLLREYVQLETPNNASWSKHIPLQTALKDGGSTPTLMPDGSQAFAVDNPHYLGPIIIGQKDRGSRVMFYNLLPTGPEGDLQIPVDTTLHGSGYGPAGAPAAVDEGTVMDEIRNPVCTEPSTLDINGNEAETSCFTDNRATIHLHGGLQPWISDGTPHQWITPAGTTPGAGGDNPTWRNHGESQEEVPDMVGAAILTKNILLEDTTDTGTPIPDCGAADDGCGTFYYTNQQSARMLFYHDHAWGVTRLNVYVGEAAGYLVRDPTEAALETAGLIPPLADNIPLVLQDRTFVPADTMLDEVSGLPTQLGEQDPTWDLTRWGKKGDFWYHHVYMPAQNPADPTGMTPFGRWMYGPWFWPPANPPHGPIVNPYYTGTCSLNDPTTWEYDTDPFCEPPMIPGTPNIAAGMEQFNDTPLINGTAYPTLTVEPKAYRFRVLNAANDRFFNLSWYKADPTTASPDLATPYAVGGSQVIGGTEVALDAGELAATQIDPNVFPTPRHDGDGNQLDAGPDWIIIGSEGGFLPKPVVRPAAPTTWIIDPTVFNVGNVDSGSLIVGSAERFDVIVDFSQYAGQTLILYNDAPAAYPARVSTYDYYFGAPDQFPVGQKSSPAGYGPNTRTVMQVKVNATLSPGVTPFPFGAAKITALTNAFNHKANGTGVFESGQHPIIVGQEEYNSAYGSQFVGTGDCYNQPTLLECDGRLRIANQGGTLFPFNTLLGDAGAIDPRMEVLVEPKAIHDEMNSAAFDEFGRMSANLGLEVVPADPGAQNIILYPYINPPAELFDATNLPKIDPALANAGVTPIASAADGTQIWRLTHNGVDTHPIHFHLYDLQLLNRVTWDNIVQPVDPSELGWKETVKVSPLEDTIVAIRPLIPQTPFEVPNSIRPLNPMETLGSSAGVYNNIDANGVPTDPIVNQLVNFGWEYVWHCHILSHEEMDMMHPQAVAMPPNAPTDLTLAYDGTVATPTELNISWSDNSIIETQFVLQRLVSAGPPAVWEDVASVPEVVNLAVANTKGVTGVTIPWDGLQDDTYRVVANNTIGYGGQFMSKTATSVSASTSTYIAAGVPQATASPAGPIALGNVAVSSSATTTVSLTNTGGLPLTITSVGFTVNTPANYTITSNNCPASLFTNQSCFVDVTLAPTAYVDYLGRLLFRTNDPVDGATTVNITGTGVSPITFTPAEGVFRFRNTRVGNSTSAVWTTDNLGTNPVRIRSVALLSPVPNADVALDFAVTSTCVGAGGIGQDLPGGGSCATTVTFAPTGNNVGIVEQMTLRIRYDDPILGTVSKFVKVRGKAI